MALTKAKPDQILAIAVDEFGITFDELLAPTQVSREVAQARLLTVNLLYAFTDLGVSAIARLLRRHESTVRYHLDHFSRVLNHEWEDLYLSAVERIRHPAAR